MKITIITPWQNHRELERDYFAAMFTADAEHIVVDDHSDPPLPNALLNRGHGFAAACNTGLAAVTTDATVFLNNDVIAHAHNWIEPIRQQLEPGVLVGAQISYSNHGKVDGTPMPYLDGWCLGGMTADLRRLGGWDETYEEPSYYGDNDLCFRARLEGMTLREARIPVEHLRNRTTGPATTTSVRYATLRNKEKFEARVRDALAVTK